MLVSASVHKRYNKPPRIDESCLLIGDSQIPFHDAHFINNVKQVAFAYGVKVCGWVGDMIDMSAMSIFLTQENKDLKKELDEDEEYLCQLADGFERVVFLAGNHEDRIMRMLEHWMGAERLGKLLGLSGGIVEMSDYYYIHIGNTWQATHPKNTSRIAGRIPSILAEKYNRNTVSFHGHLTGQIQSMNGKLVGIDAGITADPLRLEYSMVRQSTYPVMTQGAVILLKDGDEYYPRVLNKFTNWEFEIRTGELWQSYLATRHARNSDDCRTTSVRRKRPLKSRNG